MERTYRMNVDMSAETKKAPIELVRTDMQVIEVPTVGADLTSDGGLSQEVASVFGFGSGPAVPPDVFLAW